MSRWNWVEFLWRIITLSLYCWSNDPESRIGGASVGDAEKAGLKADSAESIENRKFYETEEEKRQFLRESFQLDEKEILSAAKKLK